jgi:acetate kinase
VRVLVVNAGSSSLKLALLGGDDRVLATRELAAPRAVVDPGELRAALAGGFAGADVVGHRIVHGGRRFCAAVRIDTAVEAELRDLVDLAPLHQPKSLAALDAVSAALPELPAVACFDTAFHATLPDAAATYALPAAWRERWGLRRYGFHGLSHAWVARRAPALVDRDPAGLRIVSAHLGAGASVCAISGGRSIDTTMGFTPLDGLVMATRSGSVDPGLVLWLLQHAGISEAELADALEHSSGLAGLTGSPDMRVVLTRAAAGDARAGLGLDVYLHRLRAAIAGMAAALGGLDALVFTGGVGERAAAIRSRAVDGLGFLGLGVDAERNRDVGADRNRDVTADADISVPGAEVRTLVIAAREDLEIARESRAVLAAGRLARLASRTPG